MFLGLTIIVIGLLFLLKNLGVISVDLWSMLWPLLLIALGLSILFKKKEKDKWGRFGEEIHKTFKGE